MHPQGGDRRGDDLAVDNQAQAILPAPRPLSVLLISGKRVPGKGPGRGLAVEGGDRGAGAPGEEAPVRRGDHRWGPGQAPSPGRYLFVNTVPEGVPLEVQGKVQDPPIVDWDRTHPAMRYLDLSKVAIQEAMRVRPLGGGRALVESNLTPLIYAMDEGGVKAIFLGFDLYRTDLPLRVAFPLFVSNALRWLSPSRLEDAGLQLRAGQTLAAALPAGAGMATLTDPAGRKHALQADADSRVSYVDTTSAGIYTVTADGWEQRFVVNLLDDAESNVGVHAQGVAGRAEARRAEDASALFPSRQDLWSLRARRDRAVLRRGSFIIAKSAGAGRGPPPRFAWRCCSASSGACWALISTARRTPRPCYSCWTPDSVSLENRARTRQYVAEAIRAPAPRS